MWLRRISKVHLIRWKRTFLRCSDRFVRHSIYVAHYCDKIETKKKKSSHSQHIFKHKETTKDVFCFEYQQPLHPQYYVNTYERFDELENIKKKKKKKKKENKTWFLLQNLLFVYNWSWYRSTFRLLRTALFHLQFCKNLSSLYEGTLEKEICHRKKLWRVWDFMRPKNLQSKCRNRSKQSANSQLWRLFFQNQQNWRWNKAVLRRRFYDQNISWLETKKKKAFGLLSLCPYHKFY